MMPPDCTHELVKDSDVRKVDDEAGTSPSADVIGTGEDEVDRNTESSLPSCQNPPSSGSQEVAAGDFAKVSRNFKTAADKLRAEAGCVSKSKPVFRFQPGVKEPISPVVVGLDFIGPCSDDEDDPMRDDLILQRRCYYCGAIKSVIVDIGPREDDAASKEKSRPNAAQQGGKGLSERRQQKIFTITMPCADPDTITNNNNNNLESKMRWPFCKICQTQLPVSPLVQVKNGRGPPALVPTLDRVKGHHHSAETPLFRLAIAQRRALTASQAASRSNRCGLCRLPARTVLSVSFVMVFVIILVVAVVLSVR